MPALLLAYFIGGFVSGGAGIGRRAAFDWPFMKDVLWHSALPALSLTILGGAIWFQTMKLIVQNVNAEDFVQYAKLGGVTENRIVSKYVIRNAMLPQITALALALGQIFSGALITEIVFSYPGLGGLLYNAIVTGDYNLIMGITALSIVKLTTTAILILDLIYPPGSRVRQTYRENSREILRDLFRDYDSLSASASSARCSSSRVSHLSRLMTRASETVPGDLRPSSATCWDRFQRAGHLLNATFAVRNSLVIAVIAGIVARLSRSSSG